jgi:hypothetical protein
MFSDFVVYPKKKSGKAFFGTTLTKRGYIFASTCDYIFRAKSVMVVIG